MHLTTLTLINLLRRMVGTSRRMMGRTKVTGMSVQVAQIGVYGFEAIYISCGHAWHCDCLIANFRHALLSRTNRPAKCCPQPDHIDHGAIDWALDDDVVFMLPERQAEYDSPNPIYCSNLGCASSFQTRWFRTTSNTTGSPALAARRPLASFANVLPYNTPCLAFARRSSTKRLRSSQTSRVGRLVRDLVAIR